MAANPACFISLVPTMMEKASYGATDWPLRDETTSPNAPAVRAGTYVRVKRTILGVGALALLCFHLFRAVHSFIHTKVVLQPSASSIGSGIAWSSCPDLTEFDCAYLSVPMDYTNPLPNETVSLALRRLPSTVPKKDYMGTLFINPGGPGGSGTASVVSSGPVINVILKGRYDILSWDPRGVNMTTPSIDCFPTEYDEVMVGQKLAALGLPFQALGEGGPDAELAWFKKADAYTGSGVASCGRNGNLKMLQSLSTAFNVRDMVRILEALGEKDRGLQYWGFSYGTILGATFSAMFPELVHRVLLDGVSSANLYTTDMFEWGRSGMDDTNKVFTGFVTHCARVGPTRCALAKANDSADDVRSRVDELTTGLISKPLVAPWNGVTSGIITASDVRQAIFKALYKPSVWPRLAKALADAYDGDAIALAEYVYEQGDPLVARRDPSDNIFKRHMRKTGSPLTTEAIMCSDTDPDVAHSALSAQAFRDYSHELKGLSITGENWANWVGKCRLWNITATEAYRGPWLAEDGLRKTNFPVIFLGVNADPVTPLSAARSMSLGFGNESATLLIQDGYGHCSPAHPSLCTAKILQRYYFEGEVPKYGTICESEEDFLFPGDVIAQESRQLMSVEDQELLRAMERLSESMQFM